MDETILRSLDIYGKECARRLRRNPRDPDALFAQAAVLRFTGRHTAAISNLEMLARAAPHYPGLWRFKARLHREVGDSRMETLCLKAALREESRTRDRGRPSSPAPEMAPA